MNQLQKAAGQDGGVTFFKGHLGTPLSVVCFAVFAMQSKSAQVNVAFSLQRINDVNWETSDSSYKNICQRTQTSANFPESNNRRSHEPTTQPLPPTVAHHSLQQLCPLDNSHSIKCSRETSAQGGKLEIKPKPHCVPRPPPYDDGNKGIILRLFHPSDIQRNVSVCWTTSGLSWSHRLVKSNSIKSHTHFIFTWYK